MGIFWRCVWPDPSQGMLGKLWELWRLEWFLNSKSPLLSCACGKHSAAQPPILWCSELTAKPSSRDFKAGHSVWLTQRPLSAVKELKGRISFESEVVVCIDSASLTHWFVFGRFSFFRCMGILKWILAFSGKLRLVYRVLTGVSMGGKEPGASSYLRLLLLFWPFKISITCILYYI